MAKIQSLTRQIKGKVEDIIDAAQANTTVKLRNLVGDGNVEVFAYPNDFEFYNKPPGDVIKYVDVKATGFTSGKARIELHYTDEDVGGILESSLRLYYFDEDEGIWKLTENSGVDTVNNIIYGEVDVRKLTGTPLGGSGSPVVNITSKSWFVGNFSIDYDGDGANEKVNFVLADSNSDGVYDRMYVSLNTTYNEGDLSDKIVDTNNDEVLTKSETIRIGKITVKASFDGNPTADDEDARLIRNVGKIKARIYINPIASGSKTIKIVIAAQ